VIKKIFLVGPPRSGTTLLGSLISKHKQVCYWIEPKYIWKYPKPDPYNDEITANETQPEHVKYIRNTFENFAYHNNKSVFLEKTPSNCLRIESMKKIFPEGKFIYLVRDGKDVIPSLKNKWESKHDRSALKRRTNFREIPIKQIPNYLIFFLKQLFTYSLYKGKRFRKVWGPMTHEIIAKAEKENIDEACALQYILCMKGIIRNKEDRDLIISYESLLENPKKIIKEIFEFCQLNIEEYDLNELEIINRSNSGKIKKWSDLELKEATIKELIEIDKII
jgi:hypothetical protein